MAVPINGQKTGRDRQAVDAELRSKAAEIQRRRPELTDAKAYELALQQNDALYAEFRRARWTLAGGG